MSGLSRTPGKRVWVNSPPRVRIPLSPPLAQKNNTMIVPANMAEVSTLIGTAMTLMRAQPQAGGQAGAR